MSTTEISRAFPGTAPSSGAVPTLEIPALDIDGLGFGYSGKPVLQDIAFTIAPGEFVVLLGPNGAGKTTLFALITRLYDRRVGDIRIGGFDVRNQSERAHEQIGVVFQQPTLDMDLTVRQNLLYHGALHGMPRRIALQRAREQLARVEMTDSLGQRIRHLSGGQRRRVEIARGLLHAPRLLLLDEPTVGLDIASRRILVEHVHRLCVEEGVAVLWATHLIDEVYSEDRVIVLHQGRIRADGGVAEITARTGSASIGAAFDALTGGVAT